MPPEVGEGTDEPDPALRTRRTPWLAALYALIGAVAVAVPTYLVATTDSTFAMPHAATSDGAEVVVVWRILMAMATAVAMVVVILLGIALISGARRRHASQVTGSVPLEIAYTVVPVLLVGAIFAMSLWLDARIEDVTANQDVVVDVEAFRWGWRFDYVDGPEVVAANAGDEPTLVLPVDRTVTLRLHSDDVIHSFFVPAFARKLDVVPGQDNELRVHPVEVGDYTGHCAEYCGLDHSRMNFRVAIVEADDYETFLATGDRP